MLKYQGKFQIGEHIRSYHYNPENMEDTHVYYDGIIVDIVKEPFYAYKTECYFCSHMGNKGETVYIPMERLNHEFDGRNRSIPVVFLKKLTEAKNLKVNGTTMNPFNIDPNIVELINESNWISDLTFLPEGYFTETTGLNEHGHTLRLGLTSADILSVFYDYDLGVWIIPSDGAQTEVAIDIEPY